MTPLLPLVLLFFPTSVGCCTLPPLILPAYVYALFHSAVNFNLKVKVARSSKMLVSYHILHGVTTEDLDLNLHCHKNLKSNSTNLNEKYSLNNLLFSND